MDLRAILACGYRPRVVVTEYNGKWRIDEFWTLPNNETGTHGHGVGLNPKGSALTTFYGASLAAHILLAQEFGYSLLYATNRKLNAFLCVET